MRIPLCRRYVLRNKADCRLEAGLVFVRLAYGRRCVAFIFVFVFVLLILIFFVVFVVIRISGGFMLPMTTKVENSAGVCCVISLLLGYGA
ncbi:hypothetical protein ACQ5SK_47575 [Bradyrhizobium japonicum]